MCEKSRVCSMNGVRDKTIDRNDGCRVRKEDVVRIDLLGLMFM